MKPHQLNLDAMLRAVEQHCTRVDIARALGCHPNSATRRLERAELAGLVTATQGQGRLQVWELTPRGRERLQARAE